MSDLKRPCPNHWQHAVDSAPDGRTIMTEDVSKIPLRWRPGSPDGRSAGSLSQFVREHLVRSGGGCTRDQLLQAIQRESDLAVRLERGQGLGRLLQNMKYSGFVTLLGETVLATERTLGPQSSR